MLEKEIIMDISFSILAIFVLLFAWILDLFLGDPTWMPHPIIAFGKIISFGEKRLNKGNNRFTRGAILTIVLVAGLFVLTSLLLYALPAYLIHVADVSEKIKYAVIIIQFVLSIYFVFSCLAGKTLRKEVCLVFEALNDSLSKGRKQVARIVGRDTAELSSHEVAAAALETLAENLSDGIIAPLFWWILLGIPGMMAYKMINTLDSMIGYRTPRYAQFGTFAAQLDDVVNYIPARITAYLILLIGWVHSKYTIHLSKGENEDNSVRFTWKTGKRIVSTYGKAHLSPNSGYPESALAAVLNCQFGGPHPYFGQVVVKPYIGEHKRPFTIQDMRLAVRINLWVEVVAIGVLLLLQSLLALGILSLL